MTAARSAKKVMGLASACALCDKWRTRGQRIAFTNGCFDLLHLGHIEVLETARTQADYLIVGLNTDASVRALKGPPRPVQAEQIRARLLAALACTDAIVLFDAPTPLSIIQQLKPNVLVKGGDYDENAIVGADFVKKIGGNVVIVPFFSKYSTSSLIQKIQQMRK